MKVVDFDTIVSKPVTLRHVADDTILFKNNTESFSFGLQLKAYNVFDRLKDRKTNYQTAYFLSDLQSLSSIMELRVPYTFYYDNQFTTYFKNSNNYIKVNSDNTELTFDSNFNIYDEKYFFTVSLSNNRFLYITKEIDNTTYYAYCSSETIHLSGALPSLSAHLFEYVLDDNKIKLFPYVDLEYPSNKYQVAVSNTLALTSTSTGNTAKSVFEISRNTLTKYKKNLNNLFSFYQGSFNSSDVNLNLNTSTNFVSNNYLGFTSLYTMDYCDMMYPNDTTVGFDILPLKNQSTIEEINVPANHYNSEPDYLNRSYEKIFSGLNENYGYDKIYLSYNTGTKDVHFPPSRLTYFTTPSTLSPYTRLNINDSKIEKIGGVAGDNPLISDKVFKRRLDVKNNNFIDDVNATYLCSWLSGNDTGDKVWVDRYYNPDSANFSTLSANNSFYNAVTDAGMGSTYVFDISSRLTFEGNNDYAYYHVGEQDYESYISTLKEYDLSKNIQILTGKGANSPYTYDKQDIVINCDGNKFGKFTTDHTGDMCFSFWLSANDYTSPLGYSLLGNFFEEGFGVFNTDFVTPNILLPDGNKVLFLNNDLEVYDELEIFEGDVPVNIKGIARKDNFDQFYILGENNIIYVYNSSPNLVTKLNALSGKNVTVHDIDVTENKVYVALGNNKLYYFNFDTNYSYEEEIEKGSGFDVEDRQKLYIKPNKVGSIIFNKADARILTGNEVAVDNNDITYTIRQKLPQVKNTPYNLIYKDHFVNNETNTIEVSGGDTQSVLTNIIVDDQDDLIAIYDNNRIARIRTNRELLDFKDLTFLDNASTKYLDVILDFEGKEYKQYYLIVEKTIKEGKVYVYLHKLDREFNLVVSKNIGERPKFRSLDLTKSITSFYYLKKYKASKNKLKVILKTKPKFSKTGTFKKSKSVISYDITKLSSGYNHFAVNISLTQGWMDLYVNGRKVERAAFQAGSFLLDNPLGSGMFIGALSTPYYLTFASRLGQQNKYFVKDVNIRGFKLYKKALEYQDIKILYNYHTLNRDVVWSLPIGQRTYVDTIDRVFKFNVPEKYTSYYDIEIHNLNIANKYFNRELQKEIYSELEKIIPYYDTLVGIKADPKGTTPEDCNIIVEDRLKVISNVFPSTAINNEPPVLRCIQINPGSEDLNGTIFIGTAEEIGSDTRGECCLNGTGENNKDYNTGACPPPEIIQEEIPVEDCSTNPDLCEPGLICINGLVYAEVKDSNGNIIPRKNYLRQVLDENPTYFINVTKPGLTLEQYATYGLCCVLGDDPHDFISPVATKINDGEYSISFPDDYNGICSTTGWRVDDKCIIGADGYGETLVTKRACCQKSDGTIVLDPDGTACDDDEEETITCDNTQGGSEGGDIYKTWDGVVTSTNPNSTDPRVGKRCCISRVNNIISFITLEEGEFCALDPDEIPNIEYHSMANLATFGQIEYAQVYHDLGATEPESAGGIECISVDKTGTYEPNTLKPCPIIINDVDTGDSLDDGHYIHHHAKITVTAGSELGTPGSPGLARIKLAQLPTFTQDVEPYWFTNERGEYTNGTVYVGNTYQCVGPSTASIIIKNASENTQDGKIWIAPEDIQRAIRQAKDYWQKNNPNKLDETAVTVKEDYYVLKFREWVQRTDGSGKWDFKSPENPKPVLRRSTTSTKTWGTILDILHTAIDTQATACANSGIITGANGFITGTGAQFFIERTGYWDNATIYIPIVNPTR